jgi:hypothetical protein
MSLGQNFLPIRLIWLDVTFSLSLNQKTSLKGPHFKLLEDIHLQKLDDSGERTFGSMFNKILGMAEIFQCMSKMRI